MGRRDDPKFGRDEVVRSYRRRIGFPRHLVLEYGNELMTAYGYIHNIKDSDIDPVKAKHISCRSCQNWLNL